MATFGWNVLERGQGLHAVARDADFRTEYAQQIGKRVAGVDVVIDHQHALHAQIDIL
jgi:hypothetical protein